MTAAATTEIETPRLSPSVAHTIVTESPLHAYTSHRLLGGKDRPSTAAQQAGRAWHALLLEDGEGLAPIVANSFRTKAAQVARDEALLDGKHPILSKDLSPMQAAAERILERVESFGFSLDGVIEKKLHWSEHGLGGEVLCSGQPDIVQGSLVLDLKTTDGSASAKTCAKKLIDFGGVIQDAAYRSAVGWLNPEVQGRVDVVFLFVQTVEPFDVTPVECTGAMREVGLWRWERAIETWHTCMSSDHWPGYAEAATGRTGQTVKVEPPAWVLKEEIELQEAMRDG